MPAGMAGAKKQLKHKQTRTNTRRTAATKELCKDAKSLIPENAGMEMSDKSDKSDKSD